jgi:hypothetical protein
MNIIIHAFARGINETLVIIDTHTASFQRAKWI